MANKPANSEFEWDVFISHASEDKGPFVEPLANELRKYGLRVWYDRFMLRIGSSLRESIDEGLAKSRFGIVVLSPAFFAKNWPKKELNALFSRQVNGENVILPVWHQLTKTDLSGYSPLISDLVAADSTEGFEKIARSLVQVIRPEAFQIEVCQADAQNAVKRLREKVRTRFPAMDVRVSFGSQEKDLPWPPAMNPVVSTPPDGMKMEFFVTDPAAYAKQPLSVHFSMRAEAGERFQQAQREGRVAEFGPEDGLVVRSDLADLLGDVPAADAGGYRLTVGPPVHLTQKILRFKLLFSRQNENVEFPYVEFRIVRLGQGEMEICSSSPTLPFILSLTLKTEGRPCNFQTSIATEGRDVRDIYKAYHAFSLFRDGGTMKMVTLETGTSFGVFQGDVSTSTSGAPCDDAFGNLVAIVHEVANALNAPILWPTHATEDDALHASILQQVVRTGQACLPTGSVEFKLTPRPDWDATKMLERGALFRACSNAPPDFANLFNNALDLGPHQITLQIGEAQIGPVADRPDQLAVRIVPDGPMTFEFEKFRKEDDGSCARSESD